VITDADVPTVVDALMSEPVETLPDDMSSVVVSGGHLGRREDEENALRGWLLGLGRPVLDP
jgi:hypothetical protein